MTLARFSAIVVLSLRILQVTLAQKPVLENNQHGIHNILKVPSNSSLVSNTKNCNLNCDTNAHTEASTNKSNKSNDLMGLQQFLKLRQPVVSPQQSLNVNLQQPTIYQTLQQPVSNQNQEQFQHLPLKLQNQILQQPDNQVIQKQCQQLQQQGPAATIWNSLIGRKPSSSLRVTGVSLAPLTVNSGHFRNFPSESSNGVQFSNLGFPLNLPYFAAKSCGCINTVDQIPVPVPQSNHDPISNVPIYGIEKTQWPVSMPIPIAPSSLATDSANLNIPTELTISMIPASVVPQKVESQSIQSINFTPITASTAYQSPINQVLLTQSQPFEVLQMVQPVEYQISPNQLTLNSEELDALKTPQAVTQTLKVYQPPSNAIQLVDSPSVIQLQRQNPTPFVTKQNLCSDTLPINYPAPFVMQNNHGPKSLNMKTLLQLVMGLINERNGRCQYPRNCNCGCMNNDVSNSVNYNDTQIPPPEVIEGCSNQRKYECEESPMSNNIVPENQGTPVYVPEKIKIKNDNNRKYCSEEEDDDEYEYDDED